MTAGEASAAGRSPAETKAMLRRDVLARRDALDPGFRQTASDRIALHVVQVLSGAPPAIVSGFLPIRSEIDPRPAMTALAARGHRLALPCVTPDGLVFRLWRPGDALRKAGFGLSEPEAAAPAVDPDVMLVPLAAFDRRGHRIGYGAGHYDRALARLSATQHPLALGLAFAAQEVEKVPDEPHDQPLDAIVTEDGPLPASPRMKEVLHASSLPR
jgi:5-formyltetrahydrofolate cyclo-ligase